MKVSFKLREFSPSLFQGTLLLMRCKFLNLPNIHRPKLKCNTLNMDNSPCMYLSKNVLTMPTPLVLFSLTY